MQTPLTAAQTIKRLRQQQGLLKKRYGVQQIGIFGSTARDEASSASDIDVLVEFNRPIGFFKFFELEKELSQLLGKKVDLATPNALKPAIRRQVLEDLQYV